MAINCKLALSTNTKEINEELFKAYSENSIEGMEISVDPSEYKKLDFCKIQQWAEKYNIELWSFHLPFNPFEEIEISSPDIAKQTIEIFKDYIKKANDIGIKIFVIHPSGEPIDDSIRKEKMECAKNSLKELAEYAESLGCVIAVEDLPRTCLGNNSEEILDLISGHEALRVCFDTNHLLGEDIVDFIHKVGDKIVTVHISDYDYINERHWLPGEGKIDWVSVVSALEEVGYNGYWLYEIGFTTPWSIERDRELTCRDFENNYDELMQKKQPSKFGKAKDNLGMWDFTDKEG